LIGIPHLPNKLISDDGIGSGNDEATAFLNERVVEDRLDAK
jgi:hypothetical protein